MHAFETLSLNSRGNSRMLSLRIGSHNSPSPLRLRLQTSSCGRTGSRSGASEFHSSWHVVQGVGYSLPFAPDRKNEEVNYMRHAAALSQAGFAPGGRSGKSK